MKVPAVIYKGIAGVLLLLAPALAPAQSLKVDAARHRQPHPGDGPGSGRASWWKPEQKNFCLIAAGGPFNESTS